MRLRLAPGKGPQRIWERKREEWRRLVEVFQVLRASELEQEAVKGLSSNSDLVMGMVLLDMASESFSVCSTLSDDQLYLPGVAHF